MKIEGFVGFTGLPRTGKTLACTLVSLMLATGDGGMIVGNYPIKYPQFRLITPYDLIKFLDMGRRKVRATIATQEVYAWMDSYVSMSKENRFESYFVFQASKLFYNWVWDSQRAMKVDSSLREMTPYRFRAERKRYGFRYTLMDYRFPSREVPTKKRFVLRLDEAERVYGLYDTYKGAIPLGYSEMVTSMEKLMPEVLKGTVERQVKLLRDRGGEFGLDNVKGVNRNRVEYALICLDEPIVFAKYVVEGLKSGLLERV